MARHGVRWVQPAMIKLEGKIVRSLDETGFQSWENSTKTYFTPVLPTTWNNASIARGSRTSYSYPNERERFSYTVAHRYAFRSRLRYAKRDATRRNATQRLDRARGALHNLVDFSP